VVPLVEQELLTIPDHLSSLPVFSGVRVTRFVVLCVCFVHRFVLFLLTIVLSVLLIRSAFPVILNIMCERYTDLFMDSTPSR
jgi:hypothetical protein